MTDLPSTSPEAAWEGRDLSVAIVFYRKLVKACIRRTPLWLYLACLTPPALVLTAVFAQPYVHPSLLLRDPALVHVLHGLPDHMPMYYGLVSNLGVLIWNSAAFICLFVSLLLFIKSSDIRGALFMLCSGVLTGILTIDDFFMVHETVFPYITGFDEMYLLMFYVLLFITYFTVFVFLILRSHGALFFLALFFFVTSAIFDIFVSESISYLYWLFEDGTKLFGIFTWTTFHYRVAWDMLEPVQLDRGHHQTSPTL